jgi:DNA-binding MarR family transcriptional regulator
MPAEKPLPHNLDAERTVLGAILVDNKYLAEAAAMLSGGDFFLRDNGLLFTAMLAMRDAGLPIDMLTLIDFLEKRGKVPAAPYGVQYIASLDSGIPRVIHFAHYAAIVKEKSRLRELIKRTDSIQQRAMENGADINQLENDLRASVREMPAQSNGHGDKLFYTTMEFLKAEFPAPEHLVEGLIPRGGSVLIVALPHRMKSWFTTSLAYASSVAGTALGMLEVRKPVRTLLVQVEDFPGQVQARITQLLRTRAFGEINPANVDIMPRCGFNLPDETWYQRLLQKVTDFGADHVIMDVVRRIFRGDINSPKDTALFLEHIDRLREATNCAVTLVHHENKKDAEIMTAAAGSYNLPGWANVMIQFKRKTQEAHVTHVEIEVDNKLAVSPEPMRMVLNLLSESPVVVELLEDGVGLEDALDRLGTEWTVRDLAEALGIHKSNAHRRVKKWEAAGRVQKIRKGNRGRTGGLARYTAVEQDSEIAPPVPIRRLQ